MVAGTYDGATSKVYVDGKLENSQARTGAINTNDHQVNIFGNSERWGRDWGGWIDEAAIYTRALSEQEILEWYQMGQP